MKKILTVFSLFFILAMGLVIVNKNFVTRNSSPTPIPALGVNQDYPEPGKIVLRDKEYLFAIIKVAKPEALKLIPNFSEKLTASEVREKSGCQDLVSGGFYRPDATPTGLFVSDGQVIKNWIFSRLLNGVLSVNDMATPRITFEPPRDSLRIALQTGPVLVENGKSLKLALNSDEPARRVVAGITGDNVLYFLVVYSENQVFDGPNLADLSSVLTEVQKETGLIFADAVNLDGGSASTFLTQEVQLSEISPVGSFFCTQ